MHRIFEIADTIARGAGQGHVPSPNAFTRLMDDLTDICETQPTSAAQAIVALSLKIVAIRGTLDSALLPIRELGEVSRG